MKIKVKELRRLLFKKRTMLLEGLVLRQAPVAIEKTIAFFTLIHFSPMSHFYTP